MPSEKERTKEKEAEKAGSLLTKEKARMAKVTNHKIPKAKEKGRTKTERDLMPKLREKDKSGANTATRRPTIQMHAGMVRNQKERLKE